MRTNILTDAKLVSVCEETCN